MDAKTVQQLRAASARKPHGVRARYGAGCRCLLCRAANSRYETKRLAARRRGEWNGIVSAAPVRRHLLKLGRLGVGYKQAATTADVSRTVTAGILFGRRTQCRAETARRLLAVDRGCIADRALVDAKPTWRLIERLLKFHFQTKKELAQALGYAESLQLYKSRVTARNAQRVWRLWCKYE